MIAQERGIAELRDLVHDMAARCREPGEILAALAVRSRLLASATGYRIAPITPLLREFFPDYDAVTDAEHAEEEYRRRALVLADWLAERAGSLEAEDLVRAVERHLGVE